MLLGGESTAQEVTLNTLQFLLTKAQNKVLHIKVYIKLVAGSSQSFVPNKSRNSRNWVTSPRWLVQFCFSSDKKGHLFPEILLSDSLLEVLVPEMFINPSLLFTPRANNPKNLDLSTLAIAPEAPSRDLCVGLMLGSSPKRSFV